MNIGQKLCITAAIIVAIASYIFYWYSYEYIDVYNVGGIGLIEKYLDLWFNTNWNAVVLGLPLVFYYGLVGIFTLFLISPILIALGAKKRGLALLGSIMPLVIGLFIFLYAFGIHHLLYPYFNSVPTFMSFLTVFSDAEPLFEGIPLIGEIPMSLPYKTHFEFIGTYILIGGGVMGLIAYKNSSTARF